MIYPGHLVLRLVTACRARTVRLGVVRTPLLLSCFLLPGAAVLVPHVDHGGLAPGHHLHLTGRVPLVDHRLGWRRRLRLVLILLGGRSISLGWRILLILLVLLGR